MFQLVPIPLVDGIYACAAYETCIVNQRISMRERHAFPLADGTPDRNKLYQSIHDNLVDRFPPRRIKKITATRLVERAPPAKQQRIRNALDEYRRDGWTRTDARVKMFQKWEKTEGMGVFELQSMTQDKLAAKKSRSIQHRSDKFCYVSMQYGKAMEDNIYHSRRMPGDKWARYVPPRKRIFTKGLNSFETATNAKWKWDQFTDPLAVLLDHSGYDGTLNQDLRRIVEVAYYKKCTPGSHEFHWLINQLLTLNVRSAHGDRMRVKGTMASGDWCTSFGDNLINFAIIDYWLRHHCGVKDFELMINGDDSVIIIEQRERHKLDFTFFKTVGLNTKVDFASEFHNIDYCQCKPVQTINGLRMCRDWRRLISRCSYTTKNMQTEKGWRSLIGAIAAGEISCNAGLPVVQSFALMLQRTARGHFSQALYDEHMFMRHDRQSEPTVITEEARTTFMLAYQLNPQEQRQLETLFDSVEEMPLVL